MNSDKAAAVRDSINGCPDIVNDDDHRDSGERFVIEVVLLKPNATELADAKVVDESYVIQPTDGFEALTEVEAQRYHVRTRLSGMGTYQSNTSTSTTPLVAITTN